MNERIRELIEQATTREKGPPVLDGYNSYNSEIILFDKEKFAELIVRECANAANEWQTSEHPGLLCKNVILDHFGVE